MRFGVNTWVWVSPLTTDELKKLAPLVKGMGFDWIEVPFESLNDLDPSEGAQIIRANGLGVSTCAAMSPDRDLIHPDAAIQQSGMEYIRGCVNAAQTLGATNLVGPIYSAVGRVWQQTPDERARDIDTLVTICAIWGCTQVITGWCSASSRSTVSRPASSIWRRRQWRS
jgi:D-psicose/D-tagatose/L-ribulose 3-epimerase